MLPDYVNQVTLPVLRKLRERVSAGAIVVAPRPAHSPSLADYGNEAEFRSIVKEVWGSTDGMGATERHYGKGKICWGKPVEEVMAGEKTSPVRLDPYGSVFVVFRNKAAAPSRILPHPVGTELATFSGPWQVSFPPNWGAPPQVRFDNLVSWTNSPDDGVKYFAGTAIYSKDINAPQKWFKPGAKVMLDLGTVKQIGVVSVNGKPVGGILWKRPFEVDVISALKPGSNHIEVKATNLWPNRIIGDRQPNATKKYAWLDYKPFRADTPLLESGLLGPVRVLRVGMR